MNKFHKMLMAPALLAVTGCYSPNFGWPHPFQPSSMAVEQARAQRFDPFPDPDIGPPIVGGRPRDSEPIHRDLQRSYGAVAPQPQPIYGAPAPQPCQPAPVVQGF